MEATKVIIRPVISESSIKEMELNRYVFEVDTSANKEDIARTVGSSFGVDVLGVKTRIIKGKSRRMLRKRDRVHLSPSKRATVQIAKDQKITIFESKK